MTTRLRSPNYPGLSLRDAVEKIRALYNEIGRNPTSRDVVAKGMGYRSLSGSSATAISAAKKYGLLEGRGDEVRVSDRAMAILHPHDVAEGREALRAAALSPDLFHDLAEKFPDHRVNVELLKNYLLRNGFAPQSVAQAISAYQETMDYVGRLGVGYDSEIDSEEEADPISSVGQPVLEQGRVQPVSAASFEGVEIGGLGFKGVGFVKILASPELEVRKALAMAEQVILMMRSELDSRDSNAAKIESVFVLDGTEQDR